MGASLVDDRTLGSGEAARSTRERADRCARPIRVVVAEDSYPIREFLTMVLSSASAVELVAVCSDGNELRQAIAASPPNVLVTDIRMPPSGTDEGSVSR